MPHKAYLGNREKSYFYLKLHLLLNHNPSTLLKIQNLRLPLQVSQVIFIFTWYLSEASLESI